MEGFGGAKQDARIGQSPGPAHPGCGRAVPVRERVVPHRARQSPPWVLNLRRPTCLLAAGFFFAFAGGLADMTALGRSQVSTTLPVGIARAAVAASLGLGGGMVVVALLKVPRSGGHLTG